MKATDLSKIIYECDIHALTDYYSFVEVEYDDADNNTINVFRHGYDCKKHVPKGMYFGFHLMKMKPKSSRGYWSVCLVKHTKHKSSSRMIWM